MTRRPAGVRDRERGDTLVLAALASANRRGDEVFEHLRDEARGTPVPTSRQVWTTLHRLARNRLVTRISGDPRRYRLTATGSRVLAARTEAAAAFSAALQTLQGSPVRA